MQDTRQALPAGQSPISAHNATAHIAEAELYGRRMGDAHQPSYAAAFGRLSGLHKVTCAELARYTGVSIGPGNWIAKDMDGATVYVDAQYQAGERTTWTEPGAAEQVVIVGALVNGVVVDPGYLNPQIVTRWEEEILASLEGVPA